VKDITLANDDALAARHTAAIAHVVRPKEPRPATG
jgi:hypothetical protein